MSILSQVVGLGENRSLFFTFKSDNLDQDTFKVIDFTLEEGLSSPFTAKLSLASERDDLSENDIVDQNGVLTLFRNETVERYFHGVVFSFRKGNTGRHHTYYEVTLVPTVSRLSLRTNSRIFQNKAVTEIAEELMGEMGIADYALAIRNVHNPREYCVQYCETDLDFVERLCAEEGIFYYFEHEKSKHTVIFADDNSVTSDFPFSCAYNNTEGGIAESGCIRSLINQAKVAPTEAVLKDYSFIQPSNSFLSQASGTDTGYQKSYEHYMYPGRFKDDAVGQSFSKTRVDYLRRDAKTIEGNGDIAQMISGYVMKVSDHPSIAEGDKWLVTHVKHEGTQPQSLDNEGGSGQTTYRNTFSALPYTQQWKPKPEAKPRIYGPQIAKVTGPSGEEIYTDEFGRVKVQFLWDRDGQSNENSSCWVRVAQVGAGSGFGNIVIPRIGHEVIVSFLEGDPDQPIVTGATFNAINRSSLNLPADKTKMAFRGKTHDGSGSGDGYNELSFENDDGRQLVHIHAQKDMDTKVLNDRTTHVLNDHQETINHDQTMTIDNDQTMKIGHDQTIDILNNQTETIDGNQTLMVKKNQTETVYIAKAETIGAAKALSVGAAYQVSVGAAMSEAVALIKNMAIGKNYMQQIGGHKIANIAKNQTVTITQNENTKIGKSKNLEIQDHLKLKAGKSIEIECGKSKIKIDKSGKITIDGDIFTVKTSGNQTLKANRDIILKGKTIKEN